jgi:hypothetical protein
MNIFWHSPASAVIAVQTFGNFLGFKPHCHILVTDGCFYGANGMFRVAPPLELKKLEAIFRHKVLRMLLNTRWPASRAALPRLFIEAFRSPLRKGFMPPSTRKDLTCRAPDTFSPQPSVQYSLFYRRFSFDMQDSILL